MICHFMPPLNVNHVVHHHAPVGDELTVAVQVPDLRHFTYTRTRTHTHIHTRTHTSASDISRDSFK